MHPNLRELCYIFSSLLCFFNISFCSWIQSEVADVHLEAEVTLEFCPLQRNRTGKVHWAKERQHLRTVAGALWTEMPPGRGTPWRDLLLTAYPEATVLWLRAQPAARRLPASSALDSQSPGTAGEPAEVWHPVKGTELCYQPLLKAIAISTNPVPS